LAEILQPDTLLLILAAPCIGSFLGVIAERLPAGRPLVWSRSCCVHCGQTLGARDLVPIIGWLINRGRCRHCGQAIAAFYPAIEVAATLVALWSLLVLPGWLAWAGSVLGWTLLALSVIDARHLQLPDELTLPLIPAGLAVAWIVDPASLPEHALAALGGFLLVAALAFVYRRLRGREGIGLGDAKLLAAAGAWVSWQGLPGIVLLAAAAGLAGALIKGFLAGRLETRQELPFGPYLAGGLWLVWLYGPIGLG
jgi:leader peptidase (prepilin peptidase)/N-methyltransferase